MSEQEYKQELLLEATDAQQELDSLENEFKTPSWSFLDEEDQSGFYSSYKGKTLKQHINDINILDLI